MSGVPDGAERLLQAQRTGVAATIDETQTLDRAEISQSAEQAAQFSKLIARDVMGVPSSFRRLGKCWR